MDRELADRSLHLQLQHPSAVSTTASTAAQPFPPAPASKTDGQADCWLVCSALTFENIGFTRGVGTITNTAAGQGGKVIPSLPEGASIRFLSCADCDCGPLGWYIEARGEDLGRDVEAQLQPARAGGAGAGQQVVREFLIPVERCRYKLE